MNSDSITTKRSLLLFVSLQILLTTGCGLIYQHRLETPAGTIWTNDDISNARKYQADLIWMQNGLREILPKTSRNIGTATILIDTQQRQENRIVREQEVHTAGWYNRILSLVRFTPTSLAETQFLSQEADPPQHGTLLHELTHHFTADQPGLQSRWWLTEAFACYFETAFPAPDGRFILPPLHIENYRSSRTKLREIGQQKFSKLIEQIVAANWFEFYRNDGDAPLRYAISWSILWTLQQQMSGELEDRLFQVAQLDNQQILSRIESVIQSLTPPISSQLRDHISNESYRRWSIEHWLNSNRIDGPLILSAIEKELIDDEGEIWGWPCVARTIFRWGSGLDRATRLEWQKKVERQLREGPLSVRLAICRVLTGYRRSGALIPVLVDLLASPDGSLRAAAATALARASNHPTIVNPDFWIHGSDVNRRKEIENWRRWLDSP